MRQNRKIIALTGGIACGKSTVSSVLRECGYEVIDSDKTGHDFLYDSEVINVIKSEMGIEVLSNGKVDRKKLSKLVFGDVSKKLYLEKILHPLIIKEIKYNINKSSSTLFVEVPLLFETLSLFLSYGIKFDSIWTVEASENEQLRRLMLRSGLSEEDALERINIQSAPLERIKMSDIVIYNDKTVTELKDKVLRALKCELEDKWL